MKQNKTKNEWISLYHIKLEKDKKLLKSRKGISISQPQQIYDLLNPIFASSDREQFVVLYLSTRLHPIGVEIIAVGGTHNCTVDIKNVFKGAILANATAIAVAHNHPSGISAPSSNDIVLTTQIAWAGEILEIKLIDHIIIGDENFYSFKAENPGVALTDIPLPSEEKCSAN